MARPSGNTDQKLIEAALALFPETGFSNMKVRDVARQAGVNLGLFHYHFKNKNVFAQRIMHDFYESFFSRFQWNIATVADPQLRLRQGVLTIAKFLRDHRQLMIPFLNDVLQGHQQVIQFLSENMQRHIRILVQLIKACQKNGFMAKWPVATVIFFLMGPQAVPAMALTVFEKNQRHLSGALVKLMALPQHLTDRAIEQRVDLALKAMQPNPDLRPGQ